MGASAHQPFLTATVSHCLNHLGKICSASVIWLHAGFRLLIAACYGLDCMGDLCKADMLDCSSLQEEGGVVAQQPDYFVRYGEYRCKPLLSPRPHWISLGSHHLSA